MFTFALLFVVLDCCLFVYFCVCKLRAREKNGYVNAYMANTTDSDIYIHKHFYNVLANVLMYLYRIHK